MANRAVSIVELRDDEATAQFLERERLWTAYALCDLEAPDRARARFIGAVADGEITAVVLIYASREFTGLLAYGGVEGVAGILEAAPNLPQETFMLAGEEHLDAIARRYRIEDRWTMHRMAVTRGAFRPLPARADIVRLTAADSKEITSLYELDGGNPFLEAETLQHRIYYGAYEGGSLVAVAGTHTWSRRRRIGAIGGVFTRPDRRGRGLATATTAAVAGALFDAGVEDVVLNVKVDNVPAVAAYSRLGFSAVRQYVEGEISARPLDV